MPLYEYRCECGSEGEILLPLTESDQPQVCVCGKVMQRMVSLPRPAVFSKTANDMALNTLNAPLGRGMPKRDWTPFAERKAFAGTGKAPKTVW